MVPILNPRKMADIIRNHQKMEVWYGTRIIYRSDAAHTGDPSLP